MDFIRKNIPKQKNRNGYLIVGGTSSIITNNTSTGSIIQDYLPAFYNQGAYGVYVPTNFYMDSPLWQWLKRVIADDGTVTNTPILTLKEDSMKLGDYDVLTSKYFYLDDDGNLHTKYNLVSEGEIAAYSNGITAGSAGSNITIIDNLVSTASDAALSANQGRILKELIDNINAQDSHTHPNKDVIDAITSTQITNWNNAHTNSHTHATNKNVDVYRIIMGNYGGIRKAGTEQNIILVSDNDVLINAAGRNLYLGTDNTVSTYLPTITTDNEGNNVKLWNSFNGNQFYLQMPMMVALQSVNNTLAPIQVNSSTLCPNLNADLLDGYHANNFVNSVTTSGDNIAITKGTTTTAITPNYAAKAQRLVTPSNETYLNYYDTYVNLTGTGGNINIGSQAYKNNNYNIQFITNDGSADTTGTIYWNYINGTSFTTQVPHRIFLQSTNNNQAPLQVNSTNLCTNLNADYIDGYHASSLIKTNGNQTITGTITIDGDLVVTGNVKASGEVTAYSTGINNGISNKIKTALANVESATTIDEIKTILINLREAL